MEERYPVLDCFLGEGPVAEVFNKRWLLGDDNVGLMHNVEAIVGVTLSRHDCLTVFDNGCFCLIEGGDTSKVCQLPDGDEGVAEFLEEASFYRCWWQVLQSDVPFMQVVKSFSV